MLTQAVRQHVAVIAASETFKQQISSEAELKAYGFYLTLPECLAPQFPGIDAQELEALAVYSYLYFRFIIALDKLIDQATVATTQQMLDCVALHEYAVRGLAHLFPINDAFWQRFKWCQERYASANLQEKEDARWRRELTREQFEELATGKSAICFAIVYALDELSRRTGQPGASLQPLLDCLAGIHVGSQYYDDIDDFTQDWQQGQYTYTHGLVQGFLRGQGIEEAGMPIETRQRFLFSSGIAIELMSLGQAHYAASLELASQCGLQQLLAYLQPQLSRYQELQAKLSGMISTARQQASLAEASC
ncbi:hypothetical protein LRS06_21920 [Hymenobacter sp. J193]|uniref:hypothetical protein n=1 Tax=Hymenobacter sp. J193 TaxID=2898429 RepID=UPI002150FB4F|nr:hypothetical protein [Hymenobacter sp. J193]MCR5890389.1 hypothetical protein [Hymenobacter sp. J193]